MDAETAAQLRAPFAPEQIGHIPRGGITLAYVGHAAVTDRLLSVDPDWTWEPCAVGPNGEPLITDEGLWIRLTVAGVTRYGYGDATAGKGVKEMIGDAIRNAAMRFGVGLDLWAKEDLASTGTGDPLEAPASPSQASGTGTTTGPTPERIETEQEKRARLQARVFAQIAELQAVGRPFPENTPPDVTTWDEWRKAYTRAKYGKPSFRNLTLDEVEGLAERVKREHDAQEWPV